MVPKLRSPVVEHIYLLLDLVFARFCSCCCKSVALPGPSLTLLAGADYHNFVSEASAKRRKSHLKPFKLRHPVVIGNRPPGISIDWRAWLVFCTKLMFCMTLIVAVGTAAWFFPWFRLPAIYVAIGMLISWAYLCLSRQK
jgi:hypothetical protein